MKKLFAAFLIVLTFPALADFSSFARITPETQKKYELNVYVTKSTQNEHVYVISVPKVDGLMSAWLLVTESSLEPDEQNFRGTMWSDTKGKMELEQKIRLGVQPDSLFVEEHAQPKLYHIELSQKLMDKAYIYIDYPSPVADGGYYYTIDLATYVYDKSPKAPHEKTNPDRISPADLPEMGRHSEPH